MRHILWVDDDQRLLSPFAAALSGASALFTFAHDVATALDYLKSRSWDDVIVDVGIDDGNIEARHPKVLEDMAVSGTVTGIDFANYLILSNGPFSQNAQNVILCSGFNIEYLKVEAPDLMRRVQFVSKSSRTFQENKFLSDLADALGLPLQEVGAAPAPVSPLELPFLDRYHDLKVAVSRSIPSLKRTAGRLVETSGGEGVGIAELLGAIEEFGTAVLEDVYNKPATNPVDLAKFEDALDMLVEKRAAHRSVGYTELIPVIDELQRRLAKVPTAATTGELNGACRAIQLRLCATEIDKVTSRLLGELSVDRPQLDGDSSRFDSSELLSKILDNVEPQALAGRAEFDRHILSNVLIHTSTPGQGHLFYKALTNIVDNAIKYQGRLPNANTWIVVSHGREGEWCRTTVESWGQPMRLDEINTIFDRGRRGDMARRQGDGHGLAIAFGCVRALGGTIEAKSERTKNGNAVNTFTVRLPISPRLG